MHQEYQQFFIHLKYEIQRNQVEIEAEVIWQELGRLETPLKAFTERG